MDDRTPQSAHNETGGARSNPLGRKILLFSSACAVVALHLPARAQLPLSRTEMMRRTWSSPSGNSGRKGAVDEKEPLGRRPTLARRGRSEGARRGRSGRRSSGASRDEKSPRMAMTARQLPPAWSAPEPAEPKPKKTVNKESKGKAGKKANGAAHRRAAAKIVLPKKISGGHAGGKACLTFLRKHEVPFTKSKSRRGIATPVKITGPIGGIELVDKWKPKRRPVMDCLLAATLLRAARILRKHKIAKLVFTSTYRPPRRRHPSRHGRGLAIDVRDIVFIDGTSLNVQKHWRKSYGRPNKCVGQFTTAESMKMRRIICDLEEANVFRRILTPDSDPAHRDHFHIASGADSEKWKRSRWAGRNLYQPLPGTRLYRSWHRWYRCYKYRSRRSRSRCYRHRRPGWVESGNPYKFRTKRLQPYLGPNLSRLALATASGSNAEKASTTTKQSKRQTAEMRREKRKKDPNVKPRDDGSGDKESSSDSTGSTGAEKSKYESDRTS